MLSAGERKDALAAAIEGIQQREDFEDRILACDATRAYASIATAHGAVGCTVAPTDCQIAVIARFRGMTVATRNVKDFDDIGVDCVNPWTAA